MSDTHDPVETYLGDGVYAVWEPWAGGDGMVTLDLRAQDESRIALDPYVLAKLMAFVEKCKEPK